MPQVHYWFAPSRYKTYNRPQCPALFDPRAALPALVDANPPGRRFPHPVIFPIVANVMDRKELNHRLPLFVESIVQNVLSNPQMHHLNRVLLPKREVIIESIKLLRQVVFPGYFAKQGLTTENLPFRMGELVIELSDMLYEQVRCCLRYREQLPGEDSSGKQCEVCDQEAAQIVATFWDRLPTVRDLLATDLQAAFDGDPAAQSTDETIFSYPGLFAIFVQR